MLNVAEKKGERYGFIMLVGRRRQWHPTPVPLPGESHGRRSLVGCSPWGHKESDTTERLYFHFSLSCIGERNGNSLQRSCLENPRDGGAWWAAIHGVAESQTRLKRLSSSSSNMLVGTLNLLPRRHPITHSFLNQLVTWYLLFRAFGAGFLVIDRQG